MEKLKILIIDDDEALCESIKDIFELEEHLVDISYSAKEGINKVESVYYNIILLDKKLPDAQGLGVLDKIKEISPDTEVIIFTAYAEMETVIKALDKDAFSFIHKPFDISYLIATIKRAQEKQKTIFENRKLYKQIITTKKEWEDTFDSISEMISIQDKDLNIIKCNKAIAKKLNVELKDIIGKKCYEMFSCGSNSISAFSCRKCLNTVTPHNVEIQDPLTDEFFQISSFPRFDADGQISSIINISRDITDRKLAENQLRESEERFRNTFEMAGVGIAHVSLNGRFLRLNKLCCEIIGHSADVITRIFTSQDIMHSNELETDITFEKKLIAGEIKNYTVEKHLVMKDGNVRWINITVTLVRGTDGKQKYFVYILRDITEHKQVELLLKEGEQRYRSIIDDVIDSLNVGIFILDKEIKVVWLNKAVESFFGIKRDECISKDKRKLINDKIKHLIEEPEVFKNTVFNSYNNNSYIENFTCHVLPESGCEERWLEHWSQPITTGLYAGGRVEHYTDITSIVKSKKALRKSEEKFRIISTAAPDAIIMTDSDGSISYWNMAAQKIFGFSADEIMGIRLDDLIYPIQNHLPFVSICEGLMKTVKKTVTGKTTQMIAKNKDGSIFPIDISITVVQMNQEWNIITIVRDISKRLRNEEELRMSNKLASLGQLTAGVFHELLNPLNIISSHVQLLLMEAVKGSKTEEDLISIQEEITRILKISNCLLTFSRKGELISEEHDVNDLLSKILSITVPDMKLRNITVIRKFEKGLKNIMVNPDQLRQVFLNLINNGCDAMPDGGALTLSTQSVEKGNDLFVRIMVTDTGIGIEKSKIDRIFDPFFTTKSEGKGTGLGLSTSYGIIENHKGTLRVESEKHKGSTFIIDLPVKI